MASTRYQHCFKNIPTHLIATVKGHMKQEIKHIQPTKKKSHPQKIKTAQEDKEFKNCTLYYFPPSDTPNVKTNEVMCCMITNDEKSTGCVDLTGRFPHCSSSGHEYLLVGYNYYANAILVEPLKKRQAKTIAEGWENINQQFATSGVQPHTYVLDNEVSNTLKRASEKYTVNHQLVPPQ